MDHKKGYAKKGLGGCLDYEEKKSVGGRDKRGARIRREKTWAAKSLKAVEKGWQGS